MVAGIRRQPVKDELAVNLGFVDVLFAIVVGKIIDLSLAPSLPGAAIAQLVLAATVTLTSYIGYRNSLNRPRFLIRPFVNVPFWQFVVDVALVYVYVQLATSAEVSGKSPSAMPELRALFVISILYVVWDGLAALIRISPRYEDRPLARANWYRALVSIGFVAGVAILSVWPAETQLDADAVLAVDAAATALVVAYRIAKELVPTNLPEPTSSV